MKVITANPVVYNKVRKSPNDYYIGVDNTTTAPKKGDKVKGFLQKAGQFAKDSGLVDRYLGTGTGYGAGMPPVETLPPPPPEKKGLSTGAKVGIAVGVVALLVGGYFLMKSNSKGK